MSRKRYPLRVARAACGIRAQDLRTMAKSRWWARKWIAILEGMRLGPRLGRARQYALNGQVVSLEVEGSHVDAKVVGSRSEPYRVSLDFTECGAASRIPARIAAEPMLLARLLTDDLPLEVETIFREEGAPLFLNPEMLGRTADGKPRFDVQMRCSCPDWARPCKHLVAVLLLLGEEIANRPAALLGLRGVDLDELAPPEETAAATLPVRGGGAALRTIAARENDPAPLIRRLGPMPFWRGAEKFADALGVVCRRVRDVAVRGAEGLSIDLRGGEDREKRRGG